MRLPDFFREIRANSELCTLDSATPQYEFLSYLECCQSLEVTPSVTRFASYERRWGKPNPSSKQWLE